MSLTPLIQLIFRLTTKTYEELREAANKRKMSINRSRHVPDRSRE